MKNCIKIAKNEICFRFLLLSVFSLSICSFSSAKDLANMTVAELKQLKKEVDKGLRAGADELFSHEKDRDAEAILKKINDLYATSKEIKKLLKEKGK